MSWVCIGYMDFTLIFSEPDHLYDKHCFLKVSTNLFLHSSPTASATASYQGFVRQLKSLTINISHRLLSLLTHPLSSEQERGWDKWAASNSVSYYQHLSQLRSHTENNSTLLLSTSRQDPIINGSYPGCKVIQKYKVIQQSNTTWEHTINVSTDKCLN